MTAEAATTTYSIPEPFEVALQSLRIALTGGNLRITGVLDLTGRIWRHLRVGLEPCAVLYIGPSARFLATNALPDAAALLLPLHVVVSGRGARTEIHVGKSPRLDDEAVMAPVRKLQAELRESLGAIAMRLR